MKFSTNMKWLDSWADSCLSVDEWIHLVDWNMSSKFVEIVNLHFWLPQFCPEFARLLALQIFDSMIVDIESVPFSVWTSSELPARSLEAISPVMGDVEVVHFFRIPLFLNLVEPLFLEETCPGGSFSCDFQDLTLNVQAVHNGCGLDLFQFLSRWHSILIKVGAEIKDIRWLKWFYPHLKFVLFHHLKLFSWTILACYLGTGVIWSFVSSSIFVVFFFLFLIQFEPAETVAHSSGI